MKAKKVLFVMPLLLATVSVVNAAGPLPPILSGKAGCHNCQKVSCPCCSCTLEVKDEDVKKHCYRVEYVDICIPDVKLPWPLFGHCGKGKGGKNCVGSNWGARCKTVKVLVKEEYKCKACKCVWTPVSKGGKTVPGIIKQGTVTDEESAVPGADSSDSPPAPPAIDAAGIRLPQVDAGEQVGEQVGFGYFDR